jgi:N-acetylmuramoyl-L-alanine amidase
MRICIDPGHGGKFNNAVGNGLVEKDVVLTYAGHLRSQLEHLGHDVIMTRDADVELADDLNRDLLARVRIANEWGADAFVSLHCNGFTDPSANGFEVFTSPGQTNSDRLADEILESVGTAFPLVKMRRDFSDGDGDQEAKFVVLVKTKMPAVLIELGFLTNLNDATRIKSAVAMADFTMATTEAIETYRREWLT